MQRWFTGWKHTLESIQEGLEGQAQGLICASDSPVVPKHFGLRNFHSPKNLMISKSFCLCGSYLLIFIALEIKTEKF